MRSSPFNNLPRWSCGIAAGMLAVYFLCINRHDLSVTIASFFLLLICTTDTLYAKIPNYFTLILALGGVLLHSWQGGSHGLMTALLGLLTGFLILIIPYLLGGMGAGDVKALAALGALLGPETILQVALYMALFGGLISVLYYLSTRNLITMCRAGLNTLTAFFYTRDIRIIAPESSVKSLRFPYATAIAFGFFAHNYWGNLI